MPLPMCATLRVVLILLTGYQTPDGLRKLGRTKLEGWSSRKRKAYKRLSTGGCCDRGCKHAVGAGGWARCRRVASVGKLARQVLSLNVELRELDSSIEERFRRHRHAEG